MNTRIRRKRGKQVEIERLKRGNAYLAGVIGRMQGQHETEVRTLNASCDLMTCLVCAAVMKAGGSMEVQTKGLADLLETYEVHAERKEGGTVHIEVTKIGENGKRSER